MRCALRSVAFALPAAAALLLLGCAQGPAARTAAAPPVATATAAPGATAPGVVREQPLGPGPELPRIDVVPSQGTCAPAKPSPFALTACCSGKDACRGQCVRTGAGEIACACFDTLGGCREGQVCCRFRRACTALRDCEPPE